MFKPFVSVSAFTFSRCKIEESTVSHLCSSAFTGINSSYLQLEISHVENPSLCNKPKMYHQYRLHLRKAHYHKWWEDSRQTPEKRTNPSDRAGINCCHLPTFWFVFFFVSSRHKTNTALCFCVPLYVFMLWHRGTVKSSRNMISMQKTYTYLNLARNSSNSGGKKVAADA